MNKANMIANKLNEIGVGYKRNISPYHTTFLLTKNGFKMFITVKDNKITVEEIGKGIFLPIREVTDIDYYMKYIKMFY